MLCEFEVKKIKIHCGNNIINIQNRPKVMKNRNKLKN